MRPVHFDQHRKTLQKNYQIWLLMIIHKARSQLCAAVVIFKRNCSRTIKNFYLLNLWYSHKLQNISKHRFCQIFLPTAEEDCHAGSFQNSQTKTKPIRILKIGNIIPSYLLEDLIWATPRPHGSKLVENLCETHRNTLGEWKNVSEDQFSELSAELSAACSNSNARPDAISFSA